MARYLLIKAGLVVNIVDYGAATPPLVTNEGEDVVADVTEISRVGDAFDMTDINKNRYISRIDLVIYAELFRLTNAVRALQIPPQPALTAAQYRTFIKSLIS